MTTREFNFDGLVGPTHNYSGLSVGNIASTRNQGKVANPKLAALQGLAKMKLLMDAGVAQGVIAPHERPCVATLRRAGFAGTDADVIKRAAREAPALLNAVNSASAMWAANAATVSPSADTLDKRVHFTAANLNNKFHRAIEHPTTSRILQAMFPDARHFTHHAALPGCPQLGDEGAANHTRFFSRDVGVAFFVYGAFGFDPQASAPKKFPARQTRDASLAIARLHQLDPARVVVAQQNPDVIDAGVFHNDVIAVGNKNVLFCHEHAFVDQARVLDEIKRKLSGDFVPIVVPDADVSVADAVSSYVFNSQLLTEADGSMTLLLPSECEANPAVWGYLQAMVSETGPIKKLLPVDLRESMQNGGGPACLRLRVELTEAEARAVNPHCILTPQLHVQLVAWVKKHYRDRLAEADLADVALLNESRRALDELTQLIGLGSVYPFQQI